MEIIGRKILEKLKRKNIGNVLLVFEIDALIKTIEENNFENQIELYKIRSDADCVHNDGFYFFNINIHRTLILIEFEENGEAKILWCGNHDEYENTFKNNKNTIKKWLKERGLIS
ncbi:MAG: type II toxin-antitoxin system HigB family toxin [Flavobacterium sp.]|nr:type II toxin-antitoxin system HigB family toxin [Flavobacterium sp.]